MDRPAPAGRHAGFKRPAATSVARLGKVDIVQSMASQQRSPAAAVLQVTSRLNDYPFEILSPANLQIAGGLPIRSSASIAMPGSLNNSKQSADGIVNAQNQVIALASDAGLLDGSTYLGIIYWIITAWRLRSSLGRPTQRSAHNTESGGRVLSAWYD